MRTRLVKGPKSYLLGDAEVKRVLHNARQTTREDKCEYVLFEDEPGSVAYCRGCFFGSYEYQREENIIARIVLDN